MTPSIGRTLWAIAEGYIPGKSAAQTRELESHETACLLNTGDKPAHVRITVFYADREPVRPYEVVGVGPFTDQAGGNMALFRTRAAAEAFAAGDPFRLEGLVKEYQIKDWADGMLK